MYNKKSIVCEDYYFNSGRIKLNNQYILYYLLYDQINKELKL